MGGSASGPSSHKGGYTQGRAPRAGPVSWAVADPQHTRRDRGVQAALDKLVCAGAHVFVHAHKWCGGGSLLTET